MSYSSSNEMANSIQKGKKQEAAFHMAEVTEITSGNVYLTFYGDDSQREKTYKHLSSYSPAVGDRVICAKLNGSYVILGKVV